MGTFAGKPFPESCRAYRYVTTLVNTLTIWRWWRELFLYAGELNISSRSGADLKATTTFFCR